MGYFTCRINGYKHATAADGPGDGRSHQKMFVLVI